MTSSGPRSERRRRTGEAILEAARQLFAEEGFERTTIRGVAARAGVDPGLVMQHYGSKAGLFAEAARWREEDQRMLHAPLSDVPAAALADLFSHFDEDADREASTALMRNCLTNPTAAAVMRDDVMADRRDAVAAKLVQAGVSPQEAELRAGLFGSAMMGLAMSRYLLAVRPVADAERRDIERLMLPALGALVDPTAG